MINILDQLPGYVAWKDSNLHYLGCNRKLANAFGFKHPEQIIGLMDNDLGENSEDVLAFYLNGDQLALKGKTVQMIHSIGAHDPSQSFLLEKKPLFDSNDKIVGTIFQCHELKENLISALQNHDKKNALLSSHYKVGLSENPLDLSARELECIFCILRGMTAKQIAEILNLSKRTIEFYLENVKNKFGCLTKTELLVLAIQHGYMNVIPPRFVTANLQKFFS
jgi:DNA-binding CsgD family transcriptional regulator